LILVTAMVDHTRHVQTGRATMSADDVDASAALTEAIAGAHDRQGRVARVLHARTVSFGVAAVRRFFAIDGLTHAGLLAIELFTTVIPLMIIGFSYAHGFSESANLGDHWADLLGLSGARAQDVHDLFGSASGLRSTWTIVGVAGFLVWGIPMAITVAAMYARAWQREPFGLGGKLWRGGVWFIVYLASQSARSAAMGAGHVGLARAAIVLVDVVVLWLFWSLTPVLLVRHGAHGLKALFVAGFAGLLIDGVVLTVAARIALPILLGGWAGFGPIGVAMTLMTWCGVIGYGWVATACATAILWERAAPLEVVVETNTRDASQRDRWVESPSAPG
jgi:hypothetical protein